MPYQPRRSENPKRNHSDDQLLGRNRPVIRGQREDRYERATYAVTPREPAYGNIGTAQDPWRDEKPDAGDATDKVPRIKGPSTSAHMGFRRQSFRGKLQLAASAPALQKYHAKTIASAKAPPAVAKSHAQPNASPDRIASLHRPLSNVGNALLFRRCAVQKTNAQQVRVAGSEHLRAGDVYASRSRRLT